MTNSAVKIQASDAAEYGLEDWEVTGKNSAYLFKTWVISVSNTGPQECIINFNTLEAELSGGDISLGNSNSPKDILDLFNAIKELCLSLEFTLVINVPSCEKRARVYKLFAQRVGYSVREVIQTDGDIVQYFT